MKNQCFTLFFLFLSNLLFSQDLIIKKDSTKIRCRITSIDSLVINYSIIKEKSTTKTFILREDVLNYYLSRTLTTKQEKELTKKDSLYPEKWTRFHFGMSYGKSIPLGFFSKKDAEVDSSGFAVSGFSFYLNAVYKLTPHVGISVSYYFQKNKFDSDELASSMNKSNSTSYFTASSIGQWSSRGMLGGFYITYPISKKSKIFFESSLLFGNPQYTSPFVKIEYKTNSTYSYFTQESKITNGFTYVYEIGLRKKIGNNLFLGLNFNLKRSAPKFTNVIVNFRKESYGPGFSAYSAFSETIEFKQRMLTLDARVGIIYQINKHK